jgi:hypothetical protein
MTVAVSVSIFFCNPMGNSLEAYRSAIGMFYNCSRCKMQDEICFVSDTTYIDITQGNGIIV